LEGQRPLGAGPEHRGLRGARPEPAVGPRLLGVAAHDGLLAPPDHAEEDRPVVTVAEAQALVDVPCRRVLEVADLEPTPLPGPPPPGARAAGPGGRPAAGGSKWGPSSPS